MQTTEIQTKKPHFSTDQEMQFQLGVISVNVDEDRYDLITPEGTRLRLNPRMNRYSLLHLRQQAVRVLLRASPWPISRPFEQEPMHQSSKNTYDVLFIERLGEPPELDDVVEDIPSSYNWEEESENEGIFAS